MHLNSSQYLSFFKRIHQALPIQNKIKIRDVIPTAKNAHYL